MIIFCLAMSVMTSIALKHEKNKLKREFAFFFHKYHKYFHHMKWKHSNFHSYFVLVRYWCFDYTQWKYSWHSHQKSIYQFLISPWKHIVHVGTHKKHLIKGFLMSTHNICPHRGTSNEYTQHMLSCRDLTIDTIFVFVFWVGVGGGGGWKMCLIQS